MSDKRFLSTKEAAEHIGVSVNTLRKYVAKGLVPAHKFGERLLKFDPAELDDAVKALSR
jgi:excisionase family DNA binding protein